MAPGVLQKIADIEAEMKRTQRNKATEGHLLSLRAKLSRYRQQLLDDEHRGKGGPGEGFDVSKSGLARVVLLGLPSVGKSTLLSKVTDTESVSAAYQFTTLHPVPGRLIINNVVLQMLDLPGIIAGAAGGAGRGKQVISAARTADLVLMVMDASRGDEERKILEAEMHEVGVRLNKNRPDVTVTIKKAGGVSFTSLVPQPTITEALVKQLFTFYKIHHAHILAREELDQDQLIDVVLHHTAKSPPQYLPCIYCYSKVDCVSIEEVERLSSMENSICISARDDLNLDRLMDVIWDALKLVRVYTKKRGERPDLDEAVVIRSPATVASVCNNIHKDFKDSFKHALVWGTSVKHQPQRCGLKHTLEDEDCIELRAK